MDVDDCRRLDNHLKRCRLTKFSVHDAFVAAAHERQLAEAQRVARASETAEAASARREREASELAASLFMSIRAREHRTHGRRERDRERGRDGVQEDRPLTESGPVQVSHDGQIVENLRIFTTTKEPGS